MSVAENKRLMKTLDDAWNSQDWDTFNKQHDSTPQLVLGRLRHGCL